MQQQLLQPDTHMHTTTQASSCLSCHQPGPAVSRCPEPYQELHALQDCESGASVQST